MYISYSSVLATFRGCYQSLGSVGYVVCSQTKGEKDQRISLKIDTILNCVLMFNMRANIFHTSNWLFFSILISFAIRQRTPGLEADLFYVHEGAINTYAMHFTVPVPADVHDLEFSWQSLTTYPVSL